MIYALLGFFLGVLYVEILYRMVKLGKAAVYISIPIRITLFAFTLAILAGKVFDYFWLLGGFVIGFTLNLFVRGWILDGLSKLSRTNF